MINRFSLFFLLAIISTQSLYAQRRKVNYDVNKALPWVTGEFPRNSNLIRYKVAYGEGGTYKQAREEATAFLIMELSWEYGITVTSKTVDEIKHSIKNEESNFSQNRNTTTVIEHDGYTATVTKIDEYSELDRNSTGTIKYKVWQLYTIDCPWANEITLNYSTNYSFQNAGWRSLLAPGWGQFYKKQYLKGSLFLGIEALGIASTMYFQNRYEYNLKQESQTHILDLQKEYSNRAHKCILYRNISIGTCIAIWVWNVFDATLIDGRPRYIESNFDFTFNSINNNELLLTLTYKF